MDAITNFLEKYLSTPMAKLSEQRHLRSVRDGVVSALPFIIFGSLFLIVAFPPVPADWGFAKWAAEHITSILIPYRMTMYMMTVYIAFGVGYSLAKSYKIDPLSGGLMSAASFFMTIGVVLIPGEGYFIPMGRLGGTGLFVGILVSIFAVEILRLCKKYNIVFKMPESVPSSVARSFESLIPTAIVLIALTLIVVTFGVDLHSIVDSLVKPLVKAGGTLAGVLLATFLICFFWVFGIHGDSVVGTLIRPVWEVYFAANADFIAENGAQAVAELPHIAPEPFFQWFVWIGGSGATLGLLIAMLTVGRSKYSKSLGRASLASSIFNINEPIVFGMPIVLNPVLMIPFIITPLVTATLTYFATAVHLVNATYVKPTWTLPAPFGAYLATGGDIRAVILVLVNITISFLIYLPFFKLYDKKLVEQETKDELDDTSEAVTANA